MMEFITLTISLTIAIILAGVIITSGMIAMLSSRAITKFFNKLMMKYFENIMSIYDTESK